MKLVLRTDTLLSVFFVVQQSFAHCPFDNARVISESRLVPGEDNRTVQLLVSCQDDYALLQPTTGGLRVQEINIYSTCIDPTNTSANTPEVEIFNLYRPTNVSTINVSAELGMECHYFGCYERFVTELPQTYYTFTTATCNWRPTSNIISPTGATDVLPTTYHPHESSYSSLLPFQTSSTPSCNGLHTSIFAHFAVSLQPSPSSASVELQITPIHSLVSATQDKDITSSTSVLTTTEAFIGSLTPTPSIPYSTATGSLVNIWAFPFSVLGLLIVVAATLVATFYTALKLRRNRFISDQNTAHALTVLKVDKLDPYFNPIGLDVISMHSDGTDYGYGNSTLQNEIHLVLQTAYLGTHTAKFDTMGSSSSCTTPFSSDAKPVGMPSGKSPENESDSYVQFSFTSSSNISNSIPSTDAVQSSTPVAFTEAAFNQERGPRDQDGGVQIHDIQIKSTVQLSTARAPAPLQPCTATGTCDDNPCLLHDQQDSSSGECLTEDKPVAPFCHAELESDTAYKLHRSNDLDAQNISNQSGYVPNDLFNKDVSV